MSVELLWQLQEVDQDLARISREIKQRELVLSLKQKQIEIDDLQGILDKENYEIAQLEKSAKKLEQELKNLEEKKKQREKQLYSGDCNVPKELEGFREKLAGLQEKINEAEELLLVCLDQVEDKVQIINQSSGQLEQLNKAYRKGVKIYKLTKKTFEEEITANEAKQLELKKKISKGLLEKYQAMQKKYNNTAIAKVENGLCTGCRIEIPILQLKNIKEGNTIKTCESCGRLLTVLD